MDPDRPRNEKSLKDYETWTLTCVSFMKSQETFWRFRRRSGSFQQRPIGEFFFKSAFPLNDFLLGIFVTSSSILISVVVSPSMFNFFYLVIHFPPPVFSSLITGSPNGQTYSGFIIFARKKH